MTDLTTLAEKIRSQFADFVQQIVIEHNELTVEIAKENLRHFCIALRDEHPYNFDMLIDVCGVDYLHYGISEWETDKVTGSGYSRAVNRSETLRVKSWDKPRFAVVYHLLSIENNQRIRIRVLLESEPPIMDSVVDIWPSANWFEREAFDLMGIIFNGHPDLRRILTDYGFIGHPFRKDFPISGHVEVRYDETLKRVIYEPIDLQPRVLVPKVIRKDNRYSDLVAQQGDKS